jgi:hypothetical protein
MSEEHPAVSVEERRQAALKQVHTARGLLLVMEAVIETGTRDADLFDFAHDAGNAIWEAWAISEVLRQVGDCQGSG